MLTAWSVRHEVYDGSTWGAAEAVASRSAGDVQCAFQVVAMGTDGMGRLVVSYQVPTRNGVDPNSWPHPKKYRVFDGATWSAEQMVGDAWKSTTLSAAGGAGAFYLGNMVTGGAVDSAVSLILPGSVDITATTVLTSPDTDHAGQFFVEPSGTAHGVWESGHFGCNPQCHPTGIYYTHREGGIWVEGTSGTRLACGSLFDENPGDEQMALPHIAVSASGTKLVVFTYMTDLYYVAQTHGAWGALRKADITVDAAWSYVLALGSTGRFLVVWSTLDAPWGQLYYALLQP
jgi:hypothetical protein